jgi:hypothetical protein
MLYCPDVFEGVFQQFGEAKTADEIRSEVIARSEAFSGVQVTCEQRWPTRASCSWRGSPQILR